MLKVALFLVACLIAVANCNPFGFTESQLKALANMDPALLPAELKISKAGGDNGHWCCANEMPVTSVQRTKVDKDVHVVSTQITVGHHSCGFLNTLSCSIKETRYKQVVYYFMTTYEVPNEEACPDHHVKCCKDFLEIAGNCFSLATIGQHIDLLNNLVSAGLLSGLSGGK